MPHHSNNGNDQDHDDQDRDDQDRDELEAFREAMRGVRPLNAEPRVEPARRRPSPRPRFFEADEQAALAESLTLSPEMLDIETGDELVYMRPGIQHTLVRKLRRGHIPAAAELDLHGLTATLAGNEIREFISEARARGIRCVRIIHGKGKRSGNRGPVLKEKTASVLKKRDDVLAFASAGRPVDGGTGAVFVLLRRN